MKPVYLWDYDLSESQFKAILDGGMDWGRLDGDWAAIRLLEYASYSDITCLLGFKRLVAGWPQWRDKIRSESRRRSFDFLVAWLTEHHPHLVE